MKPFAIFAFGLTMAVAAAAVSAQDVPRTYDVGPVWAISMVEVKPGQGDAYMAYLNRGWKATRLANQKSGHELAYKILTVEDARDGEPNLLLMIEYKNHAAFDRPIAEDEAVTKAVEASMGKAMELPDREKMRISRGNRTAQELIFLK